MGGDRRAAAGPGLHLLEVGVRWPPEAFVVRKLEGLVARGLRVTVASNQIRDAGLTLPGVKLLDLSPTRWSRPAACRDALAIAAHSPRQLVRLVGNLNRVPPALRRRHGGFWGLLRMCLALARVRPDVVQFEWNIAAVDYLPLFDVWECPVATSCRGSDLNVHAHLPNLRPYAERLPDVLRRAEAVHCVSEALGRQALTFGLDAGKVRVITPAVDPGLFRPCERDTPSARSGPADALRIVGVGAMRWEKGYEYALQAVRRLLDSDVPVVLDLIGAAPAGDAPPEELRIRHTIADLGLEDHVALSPQAPPAEISRRLAGADVLLHASLTEGIPNVVLEAMACGIPVVATRAGAVAEAVTDGVEGYVVDLRDPDRLAAALARLWRDPPLRTRMGRAGRATVRRRFTLARQIDQFVGLYGELVG